MTYLNQKGNIYLTALRITILITILCMLSVLASNELHREESSDSEYYLSGVISYVEGDDTQLINTISTFSEDHGISINLTIDSLDSWREAGAPSINEIVDDWCIADPGQKVILENYIVMLILISEDKTEADQLQFRVGDNLMSFYSEVKLTEIENLFQQYIRNREEAEEIISSIINFLDALGYNSDSRTDFKLSNILFIPIIGVLALISWVIIRILYSLEEKNKLNKEG